MGSKNRIFLGIITSQILHHCRNIFNENKLVISKKKAEKVKENHSQQSEYIYGISVNNYHNELSTVFKPSIRQLIKCKNSMKFLVKNLKWNLKNILKIKWWEGSTPHLCRINPL